MNIVILQGMVVGETIVRTSENLYTMAKFTFAVRKKYKRKDKKKNGYHKFKCIAWGKVGDIVCRYLQNGSRIVIVGELSDMRYKNRDGESANDVYVTVHKIYFSGNNDGEQRGDADYGLISEEEFREIPCDGAPYPVDDVSSGEQKIEEFLTFAKDDADYYMGGTDNGQIYPVL